MKVTVATEMACHAPTAAGLPRSPVLCVLGSKLGALTDVDT